MLSRFTTKPSHLRLLIFISPHLPKFPLPHQPQNPYFQNPNRNFLPLFSPKFFSSDQNNNNINNRGRDLWKFSPDSNEDSVFHEDSGDFEGFLDDEGAKKGNDFDRVKGFGEKGIVGSEKEFDWNADFGTKGSVANNERNLDGMAEIGKKGSDGSGENLDWMAVLGKKGSVGSGKEFNFMAESGKKGSDGNWELGEGGNEGDWLSETWSKENDDGADIFKGVDGGVGAGVGDVRGSREDKLSLEEKERGSNANDDDNMSEGDVDIFEGVGGVGAGVGNVGGSKEDKPWILEGDEGGEHLFDIGDADMTGLVNVESGKSVEELEAERAKREEEKRLLEREEKELSAVLEGPNRAFGDLVAASGITEEMLESLIALKDLEGVQGLPPLSEIEDMRYEKNTQKSSRAEIERQKQEEITNARVRKIDKLGRAYGTGKRKCSIARVWIQPGDFKFIVNDKEFDVYFPMLDHRAALLRPFSETKTLGSFIISCTVKGGGVSGQVGAIRLGISRALQNFEPDLRPPLKEAGFLTRDSRVVERKKPGKAKARKSFAWVKR